MIYDNTVHPNKKYKNKQTKAQKRRKIPSAHPLTKQGKTHCKHTYSLESLQSQTQNRPPRQPHQPHAAPRDASPPPHHLADITAVSHWRRAQSKDYPSTASLLAREEGLKPPPLLPVILASLVVRREDPFEEEGVGVGVSSGCKEGKAAQSPSGSL